MHDAGLAIARDRLRDPRRDDHRVRRTGRLRTLWTEDMADGQELDGLRIANPFAMLN